MKLSNHSKQRLRERTSLNHNERRKLFKLALIKGESIKQIKNDKIKRYLAPKQRYNSKIKLYKDYVFVYSKNSHQLYTIYKLPDYLKEEVKE